MNEGQPRKFAMCRPLQFAQVGVSSQVFGTINVPVRSAAFDTSERVTAVLGTVPNRWQRWH